jgi:RNA-directed DNA polymerase
VSDHAPHFEENRLPQQTLLEQILDLENMKQAWARVRSNKGAAGIDGMSVGDFPAFSQVHILRIIDQIREGRYAPAPVKRVWIPKPDGTKRPLGIPTVLDRVIQQAIAQVLSPLFDVDFSESSFGFRYGRRAHAAVGRISEAAKAGYRWGVDCDLKGYFDTVNHDLLIAQLSQRINDKRVLGLIGKYLRAGVRFEDGTTEKTAKGVPQGGPLSPLMANIMLDPLDKKIEAMGLPFARYADDFLVVTRSKTRALEVMEEVREYVEGRLKLLVNQDKSKVAPLGECAFLGFTVKGKRILLSDKAAKRFKTRIQEITSRSRGISMKQRLLELKRYCVGWFHYFKIGLPFKEVREWDGWIRRRIRLCYWKDWKVPRKRRRMLIKLGVAADEVKKASRARKGYWRMSRNSLVSIALNNTYLKEQGVPSMRDLWVRFKYGDKARV